MFHLRMLQLAQIKTARRRAAKCCWPYLLVAVKYARFLTTDMRRFGVGPRKVL